MNGVVRGLSVLFTVFILQGCVSNQQMGPGAGESRAVSVTIPVEAGIGVGSAQGEPFPEPVKSVDPFYWDFGEVKEGEVAVHEFTVKNESSKTVDIKGVNTSCGCTVSEVKKKNLSPGESTVIEIRFNSKGYAGLVDQYAYVNTDDPANPVLKLSIRANVIKK
jgi:hypothetical protein